MSVVGWSDETTAAARAAGVDTAAVNRRALDRQAEQQLEDRKAVLARAVEMYYAGEYEPGEIATWVQQQAGPDAAAIFANAWRIDEGSDEPMYAQTPDEFDWQQQSQAAELDRVAETIREAQADAAQRARQEQAQAIADDLLQRPLGKELAPAVVAKLAQMEAQAGGLADPVAALNAAYLDSKSRWEIADESRWHAEQQNSFRAPMRLEKPASVAERFPTARTIAAQREAAIVEREVELYVEAAPIAVPARVAPQKTEADFAAEATASFAKANERLHDLIVKPAGAKASRTQDVMAGFEAGGDRRSAFNSASNAAQDAAEAATSKRAYWLPESNTTALKE